MSSTAGNDPCGSRLYDTGGTLEDYSPNENITMGFQASPAEGMVTEITLTIRVFDLEEEPFGMDVLRIYNGTTTAAAAEAFVMMGSIPVPQTLVLQGDAVTFNFVSCVSLRRLPAPAVFFLRPTSPVSDLFKLIALTIFPLCAPYAVTLAQNDPAL